jgi:hypothetical protein
MPPRAVLGEPDAQGTGERGPHQGPDRPGGLHIPHTDLPRDITPGHQQGPRSREGQGGDSVGVALERPDARATHRVPQLHQPVLTPRRDEGRPAMGPPVPSPRELHACDGPAPVGVEHRPQAVCRGGVPQPQCAICARTDQGAAVRGEAGTGDGGSVGRQPRELTQGDVSQTGASKVCAISHHTLHAAAGQVRTSELRLAQHCIAEDGPWDANALPRHTAKGDPSLGQQASAGASGGGQGSMTCRGEHHRVQALRNVLEAQGLGTGGGMPG